MEESKIEIKHINTVDDQLAAKISPLLDEGTSWNLEHGNKFLEDPDNVLFLAFNGEEVVGFLTAYRLQRIDQREAEVLLYEIAVDPKFQKQGIGKNLVEAVKIWAKEVWADEVWVLTYSDNAAAMALYKSEGGEEDPPGTRMFTFKV